MATRFYFPLSEVAEVNPAFESWTDTSVGLRRRLAPFRGTSAITIGTQVGVMAGTAGHNWLDRQYVSDPLVAGITFTNASTTVKCQIMMREYATTDNIDQGWLAIKVVSRDGGTVRATLLARANYGPTLEAISNVTHRNKTLADGDTVTSTYTTVVGDRLVIEIGGSNSTSGTTPEFSYKYGEAASDLAVDETATADGAGWIEFSNDISLEYALPLTFMRPYVGVGGVLFRAPGISQGRVGKLGPLPPGLSRFRLRIPQPEGLTGIYLPPTSQTFFSNLTGTISSGQLVGTLLKQTNKTFTGALSTITGALANGLAAFRSFTGNITPAGIVEFLGSYFRQLYPSSLFSGGVFPRMGGKSPGKIARPGPSSPGLSRFRAPFRILDPNRSLSAQTFGIDLAGSLSSVVGALLKQPQRILAGTVTSGQLVGTLANTKVVLISLTGAISTITGTLVKQVNKIFAGAITPTGALLKQVNKLFSGAITPSGALLKQINKLFTGNITPSATVTFVRVILLSVSGSISSIVGTLVKQVNKIFTGAISTITGTLVKQVNKIFSGGVTPSAVGVFTRIVLISKTGSISTITGALVKQINKVLSGTVTPTALLVKSLTKTFTGVVSSIQGTLTTGVNVTFDLSRLLYPWMGFSGSITPLIGGRAAGPIARPGPMGGGLSRFRETFQVISHNRRSPFTIFMSFVGSLTLSGVVSTVKVSSVVVSGVISTILGDLILNPIRQVFDKLWPYALFGGGVRPLFGPQSEGQVGRPGPMRGGISRFRTTQVQGSKQSTGFTFFIALTGTILTITGSISSTYFGVRAFTGSITVISGALVRQTNKLITGNISIISGSLNKNIGKLLTGSISTITGTIVKIKVSLISLTGAISTITGTLVKQVNKIFSGIITPNGILLKQVNKVLIGTLSSVQLVGSLLKTTQKNVVGVLGNTRIVGTISTTKTSLRSFTGSISMTGIVTKLTQLVRSGGIFPIGILIKKTVMNFVGRVREIVPEGDVVVSKGKSVVISGVISIIHGIFSKQVNKVLSGTIIPTSAVSRFVSRFLNGVIVPTGLVNIRPSFQLTIQKAEDWIRGTAWTKIIGTAWEKITGRSRNP